MDIGDLVSAAAGRRLSRQRRSPHRPPGTRQPMSTRSFLIAAAVLASAAAAQAITIEAFVERHDADGDGLLSVDEVDLGGLLDANRDGIVQLAELEAVSQTFARRTFRWVNPLPDGETYEGVRHATFTSPSMGVPVGYCIYLPPQYDQASHADRRFPVVYDLHGGSPGDERTSVRGGLASVIHRAIANGDVAPAIHVFVNGGAENTYNYPQKDSLGVDVFVQELIPHIDATYRTIAGRHGRALQGFSQGGRGTTRIMFQQSGAVRFRRAGGRRLCPGATDLLERRSRARRPASRLARACLRPGRERLRPGTTVCPPGTTARRSTSWCGSATRTLNHAANLRYMAFLDELDIPFERLILPGVEHSAQVYREAGVRVLEFHLASFAGAGEHP